MGWVVSFTPWPFYLQDGTHWTGGQVTPTDDGLESLQVREISCRCRIWNDEYSNNHSAAVLISTLASYLGAKGQCLNLGPGDWRSWLAFWVASEFLYASVFQPQARTVVWWHAKFFCKKTFCSQFSFKYDNGMNKIVYLSSICRVELVKYKLYVTNIFSAWWYTTLFCSWQWCTRKKGWKALLSSSGL